MPTLAKLSAIVAVAATATAQANPFVVFPQDPERQTITAASYVRRPDWNNAAEALQQFHPDWFRGLGDGGGACLVFGFYHWAADENVTTAETYDLVLRSALPTGGPDPSAAGVLLRITGLSTPTSTGTRGSFIMTDAFATPVQVPCSGEWFAGIGMPANPNWPTSDGHALWAADLPGISPATTGENPRIGAPNVTWRIDALGSTATTPWTCILGPLLRQPTLRVGGSDPLSTRQGASGGPNYGMGGLFPDISGAPRSDGITLRAQDNAIPGAIVFFAGAAAFAATPLTVPGISGSWHVDPFATTSLGFTLMGNGAADLPLAAPGRIPASLVGLSFCFQALRVDPVTLAGAFTNAQATRF